VTNAPQLQLGAENNIEKSRCLAQLQKKIHMRRARGPGFSGIRADRLTRRKLAEPWFAVFSGM
jgi:hypothetical protein